MKIAVAVFLLSLGFVTSEFERPSICELEMDVGSCTARFYHYFYNITSDSCQVFRYTGCGGNENRFNREEACKKTCMNE
ncbi:Uncharacterised protein g1853 [Pycnogonum litorale]